MPASCHSGSKHPRHHARFSLCAHDDRAFRSYGVGSTPDSSLCSQQPRVGLRGEPWELYDIVVLLLLRKYSRGQVSSVCTLISSFFCAPFPSLDFLFKLPNLDYFCMIFRIFLLLRRTIVTRAYGTHKNLFYLSLCTNNIYSYLLWSLAIGLQHLRVITDSFGRELIM